MNTMSRACYTHTTKRSPVYQEMPSRNSSGRFTRRKEREIPKTSVKMKIFVFLGGLAVIMSIPMVMVYQLGMGTSEFYWANNALNIFADWSIWYLNFIPLWIIICQLWIINKASLINVVRWIAVFYLGYWLFYDWTWWMITAIINPSAFSWTNTHYFDIIIPDPQMWLFLVISIVGFLLSIVLVRVKRVKWKKIIPFLIYLAYVYVPGAITQVIELPLVFFVAFASISIPLALCVYFAYN